jgi:hypothetical protein
MANIIQSALLVLNNSFHSLLVENETHKIMSTKHEQDLNSVRLIVQALQTENIQLKEQVTFLLHENSTVKESNTGLMNSLREMSERLVELSSENINELPDEIHVQEEEINHEQEEQLVEQVEEQVQQDHQEEQQEQEQIEEHPREETHEPSHIEEIEVQPHVQEPRNMYETVYTLTRNYREQITRVTSGASVSQIRSVSWQMGRYRPNATVPQKIIIALSRSNFGPSSINTLSTVISVNANELKKYIRELKKQNIITEL